MVKQYYIAHHGIKGQRWGVRRYQNEDGTLTAEGQRRYGTFENMERVRSRNRKIAVGTTAAVATAATVIAVKRHNKNKAELSSAKSKIDALKTDNELSKKLIDNFSNKLDQNKEVMNNLKENLNISERIAERHSQRNQFLSEELKKMKPIVDKYDRQVAVKKANLDLARRAKKDYSTIGYSELTGKFKIPKGANVHVKNLNHEGGSMIAASLFNVKGGLVQLATKKGG